MTTDELLQRWQWLKNKYPDAVLLFQVNGVYTTCLGDVETVAAACGLPVLDESICFPVNKLDVYLSRMVRAGLRVAICDDVMGLEIKKPKNAIPREGTIERIFYDRFVAFMEKKRAAAPAQLSLF